MRIAAVTALPLDAAATPSQPRIREAARELETQFAHMLVKSMRSTTSGDPLGGDNSTYRDMYDQQLAREITKGKGLGLEFLRHIERCALIVHVLDCATLEPGRDPMTDLDVIENELSLYVPDADLGGRGTAAWPDA